MPFEYRTICKPDNFWPFEYSDGYCISSPRYGACKNKSVTLLHLSEAVWNLKLGRLNWTLTSRSRTRSDATVSCYRQISLRRPKIKLIKNTVMIQIPNTHIPEILKKNILRLAPLLGHVNNKNFKVNFKNISFFFLLVLFCVRVGNGDKYYS